MTTLIAAPAGSLRPVPWRRLGGVVWRRHRTTFVATAAVLAVIACYLAITGEQMRSAYTTYLACRPVHSMKCQLDSQQFHDVYGQPGLLGVVLLFLPGIIGAFAGAPVFARELETGTFRYAWTQGVGRMRWAIATLIPAGIGVAAWAPWAHWSPGTTSH